MKSLNIQFLSKVKIKNKLIIIILSVTYVALFLFSGIILINDINSKKQNHINTIATLSKVLERYMSESIYYRDVDSAYTIISSLEQFPVVSDAKVFTDKGELFVSYEKSGVFNKPGNLTFETEEGVESRFYVMKRNLVFNAGDDGTKSVGILIIRSSTEMIRKEIFSLILNFFLILLGISFLIWVVTYKVQELISKPIFYLTEKFKAISFTSDYSNTIDLERDDEFGLLFQGFNDLLEQINQREHEKMAVLKDLQNSKEFFSKIFHSSPDAIVITYTENDGFYIMDCNSKAEDMFGLTLGNVKGGRIKDLFVKEDGVALSRIGRAIRTKGRLSSFPTELKSVSGNVLNCLVSAETVSILEKEVHIIVIRDVSEEKKTELLLRKLSTAIEQAAEDVMVTDRDGVIEYVNPSFEKNTGYPKEEVIGKKPSILKSGKHDNLFYENLWKTILSGNVWTGRVINKTKDGKLKELEASISPILNMRDEIIGFVSLKRDMTRQAIIEKQLRQAQKMESIGTLAGGIAHDFNNILFAISGNAEMMISKLGGSADIVKRNLNNIMTASNRATDLVKQILTFSRSEDVAMSTLNMIPIIKETSKMLLSTLPPSINVEKTLDMDECNVIGNASQLHQVLLNLCTNAVHAIGKNTGTLKISLEKVVLGKKVIGVRHLKEGTYALLKVSDTGTGIPPEVIEKIFDPFFTTKAPGEGTGMGLSTVHGIISQHKGDIRVYSEVGKGSSFHIYLPLVMDDDTASEISGPEDRLTGGTEHVLFVDDEKSIVMIAQEMLTEMGYKVTVFQDSQKAFDAFSINPFLYDMVITDYMMPGLTGVELAERIKSVRSDIPVVLETGNINQVYKDHGRELPVDEMVEKPVTIFKLDAIIRNHIKRKY